MIEAALTTIIVGMGTVAIMGLVSSGLGANEQAAQITTAVNLAENVHELCDRLPYPPQSTTTWGIPAGSNISQLLTSGNLSWLNGASGASPAGVTFSPPIDSTATGLPATTWENWEQTVTVTSVNPTNVTSTTTSNNTNPKNNEVAQITVTVLYCSDPTATTPSWKPMYQTSWLAAR